MRWSLIDESWKHPAINYLNIFALGFLIPDVRHSHSISVLTEKSRTQIFLKQNIADLFISSPDSHHIQDKNDFPLEFYINCINQ